MIGLDTNVLVRYFTDDHPDQSEAARLLMEERLTIEQPGFVNLIVLAEMTWSLRSIYGFGKDEVMGAVDALLQSKEIVVERERTVATAVNLHKNSGLDFVDALISVSNEESGCSETRTFDRRFARSKAARLVTD